MRHTRQRQGRMAMIEGMRSTRMMGTAAVERQGGARWLAGSGEGPGERLLPVPALSPERRHTLSRHVLQQGAEPRQGSAQEPSEFPRYVGAQLHCHSSIEGPASIGA